MTTPAFHADARWRQFRKLTEVSRALTYAVSLEEVLNLAVSRAVELLEARKGVLMLTNEDGLLCVRAAHGLDKATCDRFREPLAETLVARLHGLLGDAEEEHFLGVPLVVGGEVTGLLAVARPHETGNIEEEEWLLSALADQAAVALEKTRLDETAVFRERFIGIVSHDLRNPISAISVAADLLLQRPGLDESTTKTALRIKNSVGRAARLIEDLLDYTQARLGGGIRVNQKPADFHTIARQVVEELELAHPDRKIEVTQRGDGRGEWDPDRLAQAIGNLGSNALHYSPRGTVVRLTCEASGDEVFLTVHNQGTPILPERLPQVFEPMQRATSDPTQAGRSVGLGLYIVKQIAEAHRGRVSIESSKDTGTTATLVLPRRSRSADRRPPAS